MGLATAEGRGLDQLQLQGLVYIAHGWRLALSGEPLTGDRPEAWDVGPVYSRLAAALAGYGRHLVLGEVPRSDAFPGFQSNLDHSETALIAEIYQNYAALESWQLSALTRKGDTPWRRVFCDGAGKGRDIPHEMIRAIKLVMRTRLQRRERVAASVMRAMNWRGLNAKAQM